MGLTAEEKAELAQLENEIGGLTPEEFEELKALEAEVGVTQDSPTTKAAQKRLTPQGFTEEEPQAPTQAQEWMGGDKNPLGLTSQGVIEGAIENLPAIGGAIGGLPAVTGVGLPVAMSLAGAGGYLGKRLQNLIRTTQGRGPKDWQEAELGPLQSGVTEGLTAGALPLAGKALKAGGRAIYNQAWSPVAQALAKFNKSGIGDVAYEGGIWNPLKLREGLENLISNKMDKVRALYKKAGDAGAKVDLKKAMKEAQDYVDDFRAKAGNNKELLERAQNMQNQLDDIVASGSPSPEQVAFWKTQEYHKLGDSAFSEFSKTKAGKAFEKKVAKGYKQGVEDSVGAAIDPLAKKEVIKLNDEVGKILSSRRAQQSLQNLKERQFEGLLTPFPTGTEAITGAGVYAMSQDPTKSLTAMAIQKLLRAGQVGTMPGGYAAQKIGDALPKIQRAAPWVPHALRSTIEGE